MTLNQLIDDILLEARNSNISESEQLSRHQIELWIKTYRAFLIKQDLDKGRTINPLYIQTMKVHISKVEDNPGYYEFKSDEELPKLIDLNYKTGVVAVKDMHGNIIQFGSETKMKLQKYRKYTCSDYIAYIKNNYIYLKGTDLLEYINLDVIVEDPTNIKMCYNPDEDEYPLPAAMWATVKQLIFTRDIPTLLKTITDVTNDSKDDTKNNAK